MISLKQIQKKTNRIFFHLIHACQFNRQQYIMPNNKKNGVSHIGISTSSGAHREG